MRTRILLCDNHDLVRRGLRCVIEGWPDYVVEREATSGQEAVAAYREVHPDLVLMDVAMPEMNGIEATRTIVAEDPDARIIALSLYAAREYVTAMLNAGARGYVLKHRAVEDLPPAIKAALAGEQFLSPSLDPQADGRSRGSFVSNVPLPKDLPPADLS